jgi:hypothetical protein
LGDEGLGDEGLDEFYEKAAGLARQNIDHQTTASTAVMKAKAAQMDRISTLIADVIVEPSSVQA